MLLGHMSIEVLREEACDCLFEIVNKGMDPVDKMKLVESLCQVLQSAGFFSIDQVSKLLYKLLKFGPVKNNRLEHIVAACRPVLVSHSTARSDLPAPPPLHSYTSLKQQVRK